MSLPFSSALPEALTWRYATKRFDAERKIPAHEWRLLEQALHLAPSSFGVQPWKFLVIDDPGLRAALHPAAWNQTQVIEASHLVVFCRQVAPGAGDVERLMRRTAEVRGVPLESLEAYSNLVNGFLGAGPVDFNVSDWAARQVYLALGFFLLAAAGLGIDACPLEGFDPAEFDRLLELEGTGYASTVLAAAGYRSPSDKYSQAAKVRFLETEVIEHR